MSEGPTTSPPRHDPGRLLPTLGIFSATMLVAGGVIGSGIFRKPGIMAAQVGSPRLLLAVWLVAGVVSLLGALSNAELASMMPGTGGQYIFLRRAYGPFVAFLYGWGLLAVVQTGSIAALAYVFAEYAGRVFPLPSDPTALAGFSFHWPLVGDITPFREVGVKCLAGAAIIALTLINCIGVRLGGVVQNVFSLAKMGAMLALALFVLFTPGVAQIANLTQASATIHPVGLAWWAAVAAALQGAFWAYDGWHKITYIGGELKSPQRDLPRSLILGILLVAALYMILSGIYSLALPVDQMAASKLVAADVAQRCVPGGDRWIALAVMLSTLGAANAVILTSARVYFSMSRDGLLPTLLGRAHPRFHTPFASLIAQGFWSLALLWSGTFDTLTDTLIFVSWFFYIANAGAVFVLRRREPDAPRPFRVPLYPWAPAVFVAFGLVYLILTFSNDLAAYRKAVAEGRPAILNAAFGFAMVLSGAPIYLWYRARSKWRADAGSASDSV
ncbi:MAG: amino acid permease [Verrucomicrobia bacterium]|nr:amino acid permease [Verrucomicrobiota bacterium]MBI3868113.1 amino acid permease [Verrucomicrobiota bacterium]